MKKAGLLILILLTAYIGGIYEDPALMALAVAELLLAVVMWLLAGYMAGRLELQIPAARILAVRGQTFQCWVTVKSRGILSVSRFVVRIGSRYEGGGRREDKKVYGGAMPGESRLWVEERADHCGIRTFQAEEIRVRLEEAGAGRGGEMSRQSRASGSAYVKYAGYGNTGPETCRGISTGTRRHAADSSGSKSTRRSRGGGLSSAWT